MSEKNKIDLTAVLFLVVAFTVFYFYSQKDVEVEKNMLEQCLDQTIERLNKEQTSEIEQFVITKIKGLDYKDECYFEVKFQFINVVDSLVKESSGVVTFTIGEPVIYIDDQSNEASQVVSQVIEDEGYKIFFNSLDIKEYEEHHTYQYYEDGIIKKK
jgi:hypothetical protein